MAKKTDSIKDNVQGLKRLPWAKIKGYDANTLKSGDKRQVSKLKKAITTSGFNFPLYLWEEGHYIIDGAGRIAALRELEREGVTIPDIPVVGIKADSLDAARILVLQASSEHGAATQESFAAFVEGLGIESILDQISYPDLDLGGDDIISLAAAVDPNLVPELPDSAPATTKPGDLWKLGEHRLLCGDSTNPDHLQRLMGEDKADMLCCDPPYGVDYSDKNKHLNKAGKGNFVQTPILNDAIEDYRSWFGGWLSLAGAYMADYNTVYISMSGKELHNLRLAFEDAGCTWSDYIIWVKNNHVLGRKDYHAKHELILYGWRGKHKFFGGRTRNTVLEYNKPQVSKLHPTMKPVELIEQLISDGTEGKGAIVLDLFGGSGTTLIASERLGRASRLMELSPVYCDVIVRRWEEFTGQKAVLEV